MPNGINIYQHKKNIPLKGRAKGYKSKQNDIRYRPRIKRKPVSYSDLIDDVFRGTTKAFSENEIVKTLTNRIMELKRDTKPGFAD